MGNEYKLIGSEYTLLHGKVEHLIYSKLIRSNAFFSFDSEWRKALTNLFILNASINLFAEHQGIPLKNITSLLEEEMSKMEAKEEYRAILAACREKLGSTFEEKIIRRVELAVSRLNTGVPYGTSFAGDNFALPSE